MCIPRNSIAELLIIQIISTVMLFADLFQHVQTGNRPKSYHTFVEVNMEGHAKTAVHL